MKKLYTEIVPNCSKATLQAIFKGKVDMDSTIHSDKWAGYNGLVDLGYKRHYRLDHGNDEFVRGRAHIKGIERFWGYAKTRLAKFKGMHKSTLYLHIKETEFSYNYRNQDLCKLLLQILRNKPLKLS